MVSPMPLFAGVAPVFTVDGTVRGELARDLVRLEIESTTRGLDTLSLRLVAVGPDAGGEAAAQLYLDGRILDFGRRLEVSIGPGAAPATVFRGSISAIEAAFAEGRAPEVVVRAEDRLMALRLTQRRTTYRDQGDADIARRIAGEHGLTADVDADGPTYDLVQQWNQTDLAFLRERAALLQADLWADGDTLGFKTRDRRSGTRLTLVQGNDLVEAHCRADLAFQATAVRVAGYDASARELIEEEADAAALAAEAATVPGGSTGAAVLERAVAARPWVRVQDAPLTTGEARAWSRAEMQRRGRAFVSVSGLTRGHPTLRVGSVLRLERVGAPFEGDGYYVTRTLHTYDLVDGYRTRFEAERAALGAFA